MEDGQGGCGLDASMAAPIARNWATVTVGGICGGGEAAMSWWMLARLGRK